MALKITRDEFRAEPDRWVRHACYEPVTIVDPDSGLVRMTLSCSRSARPQQHLACVIAALLGMAVSVILFLLYGG